LVGTFHEFLRFCFSFVKFPVSFFDKKMFMVTLNVTQEKMAESFCKNTPTLAEQRLSNQTHFSQEE